MSKVIEIKFDTKTTYCQNIIVSDDVFEKLIKLHQCDLTDYDKNWKPIEEYHIINDIIDFKDIVSTGDFENIEIVDMTK